MVTIAELQKKMLDDSAAVQNRHRYNESNKYFDGNITLALTNLLLEYNSPQFYANPGLYKEIASAATAISNPESFPDMSNPLVHNAALVPFLGGSIARSIPNMFAPIHPLLGATTSQSKILRGEDRLLDLFNGSVYIRPTLSPPFYKKIEGTYSINNSAPYRDAILPTSIGEYRNKSTTNLYSETNKRDSNGIIRGYSEQHTTEDGKIDYARLFSNVSNVTFQQPIAKSNDLADKFQKSHSFFSKRSAKMSVAEDNEFTKYTDGSPIKGIINFDTTNGGIPLSTIRTQDNLFFPFVIVDMRTKYGILLRPYSESDIVKENFSISVDEDTYIGRIGSIYRYKNTSRKLMFNFFIIPESEQDLYYMNHKLNFMKNLIHPAYRDFTYNLGNTSVSMNAISSGPIVEVRFGNYIYNPASVGPVSGVIGMITSFDADPYRFNWEITDGRQIPQGFKVSMEVGVINQDNPGIRYNSTENKFEFTKFVDIM